MERNWNDSQFNIAALLLIALFALFLNACGKEGVAPLATNNDLVSPSNPYTDQFQNDLSGALSGLGLGSGSGTGTASPIEQTTLSNLTDELGKVNPQLEATQLPPEIVSALNQLFQLQSKKNISPEESSRLAQMKYAIAGQMLQSCASKIANYVPRPGEPLLGDWSTNKEDKGLIGNLIGGIFGKNGTKSFSIRGNFAVNFTSNQNGSVLATTNPGFGQSVGLGGATYFIDGNRDLSGPLAASSNGVLSFNNGRYSGAFSDIPQAGKGSIAQNGRKIHDAVLIRSASQVPLKYAEGMKRAGQCFRQALFVMSPVMDRLFSGMDPKLAQILRNQMLGLQ